MFRRTILVAGLALAVLSVGYRLRQQRSVFAAAERGASYSNVPPKVSGEPAGARGTANALVPTAGAVLTAPQGLEPVVASTASPTEYRSEIRVRVFFDSRDQARRIPSRSGDSLNWRDAVTPARGRLQFSMTDTEDESVSFESSMDLDEEGIASFALPEAWRARLSSPKASAEARASLVVAPGLAPLEAVRLDQVSIFEVVELAFAVESGIVLEGRVAGLGEDGQGAVAHLIPGRVADADLEEWLGGPRLRSRASRDELLRFEASPLAQANSISVRSDGSFGPLWLPKAQAAWVAVSGPRGFGTWRAEVPAELRSGDLWNVGPVELKAPTALELRVRATDASVPAGCRIIWQAQGVAEAAAQQDSGTDWNCADYEPVLRAVDGDLASLLYDAVEGGPTLQSGEGGRVRLAPLPPTAQRVSLHVVLPDGRQTSAIQVELVPESTTQVDVDLSEHFAVDELRGVCVEGRVLWEDGEPAQGVQLAHASLGLAAHATTDNQGRFRIEGLTPGREHAFRLTGWDNQDPERDRWRLATFDSRATRTRGPTLETTECARVEWSLERPRYLLARGLELPENAFSGARPIAWSLQELGSDGGWTSYPLKSVHCFDRGNRSDARVALPAANTGPRRLRLVAIWGPLSTTATRPIELHPRGPLELNTSFETRAERPAIDVTGLAYDHNGKVLAGVEIHAFSSCGDSAPAAVRSDRYGGFFFDNVRVEELILYVASDDGEAEMRFDPRESPFVELRLR